KPESDTLKWRKLYQELEQTTDQGRDCQSDQTPFAKMRVTPVRLRIEPVAEGNSANDRTKVEEARRHRRYSEHVLGVEHSHCERGKRHEQNEREHDAREQNGELRLVRGESRRENGDHLRRENYAEHNNGAHEYNGERGDLARQPPCRGITLGCDPAGEGCDERSRERALCK